MSVITVKDKRAIKEIFQKEFDRILGVNDPKMRNVHFLIETIKANAQHIGRLEEQLKGLVQQITLEQAKIRLLEKYIDKMDLVDDYQIFLNALNKELDKTEMLTEP